MKGRETIKKLLLSLYQLGFFALEALKGRARFNPRIVVGDWPHSKSRARYLILGTIDVTEDQILTEVWGRTYPFENCPQKEFFRKLKDGEEIELDPYFLENKAKIESQEFDGWLQDRLQLWRQFRIQSRSFTPIAIRHRCGKFIIQDGAHRMSIASINSLGSFDLGIVFWKFKNN